MITADAISPGQSKWLSLIEIFYPEVYASGVITAKQMRTAHDHFFKLRNEDERYKVGWPIWLIMNNVITPGVGIYKLPVDSEDLSEPKSTSEDLDHPFYAKYIAELKTFGIEYPKLD